ncbi:secreted antigen 3 [Babesia divergens]|uniref:Secreted antigen 3 n=1 Tax=Babesia divergens TaxID=32595 RepID=A0AAD9GES0_BABDI|nr:secreted antigen 3 [Babesia divergens]
MAAEGDCSNFPQPGSLKDILELLAKLYKAESLKKSVGQKLLQDVQTYCKGSDNFYKSGSSSSEVLSGVLYGAYETRTYILETSEQTKYGTYNDLEDLHGTHEDCVPRALKKCLPQGYSALYYLYFMCYSGLDTIKGSQWTSETCDGSRSSDQNLKNWLTDQEGTSDSGHIKRGFSDMDLKNSMGLQVAPVIKQIISHDTPGPLQKALSYLLFSCDLDHALLGHACAFLIKFCSEVKGGPKKDFKGYSEELKNVCQGLESQLRQISNGNEGYLWAVSQGTSNVYNDVFRDESLDAYCTWLRDNLERIIDSLKAMSSDASTNWTRDKIQTASTPGPFKYGFIFKDGWTDNDFSQLTNTIEKLTNSGSNSLVKLNEILKKRITSEAIAGNTAESSSGAAAAGASVGVLSLGGAGVGAAYGFNLFGLKDIMSGVFGAIRGLVVGF